LLRHGTRIAFVSTRSGNFNIWAVEVDVERLGRELAIQPRYRAQLTGCVV